MRWGFLGAGGIARNSLGPAVHAARWAELRAAAARDCGRAELLGAEVVHADYAAVLADPSVDIVYVSLHNSAHLDWTVRALRAGKHVVCEKPLGLTADEVATMTSVAAEEGRLLVEACWNRWHPRTRMVADLLREGELGTVRSVRAQFLGERPAPGNYRHDPLLGGGALYDVGCYAIAGALLAFDWQRPVAVSARQRTDPAGADSHVRAELGFPSGTAVVEAGLTGERAEVLRIVGDAGEVTLADPAFTAGAGPARLDWRTAARGQGSTTFEPVNPYILMVDAICAALRGDDGAFVVSLADSLVVAQVVDAIKATL